MRLTADIPGERLDAFLARRGENLTRSAAQKLLEDGLVQLNGKPGRKNDKLKLGDTVDFSIPEPKAVDITPTEMQLDIAYEDEDVVVINKPKGLVVHPAAGHQEDTLVNGLLYAMGGALSGINGELRPGIVHRIDKDPSGLLAVRPHRAAPHRPEENVRHRPQFQGGRDPLGSGGAVPGLYLGALPAGNRAYPSDSGPHGAHRPPSAGGHGLRPQKAGAGPVQPMPPRRDAVLPPSPGRATGGGARAAARVF